MRRLAIVVALLAACGGGASRDLAWPAQPDPETDGGESLEPRTAAAGLAEAAAEPDADDDDDLAAILADVAAVSTPAASPATEAVPAAPAEDEVITTEEITIEISDDDD